MHVPIERRTSIAKPPAPPESARQVRAEAAGPFVHRNGSNPARMTNIGEILVGIVVAAIVATAGTLVMTPMVLLVVSTVDQRAIYIRV